MNTIRCVDIEHADGGLAAFRLTNQPRTVPAKVPIPALAPRMKQLNNLAADAPRQVGAFAQVATLATPSQVRQIALASVLSCDDMFDVEGERFIVLVDPAVLAPKTGS